MGTLPWLWPPAARIHCVRRARIPKSWLSVVCDEPSSCREPVSSSLRGTRNLTDDSRETQALSAVCSVQAINPLDSSLPSLCLYPISAYPWVLIVTLSCMVPSSSITAVLTLCMQASTVNALIVLHTKGQMGVHILTPGVPRTARP